ncbi:Reverse transcriptase [Theobroma cacao]|nr:Reverse transcriptase [Theobroma cacao]
MAVMSFLAGLPPELETVKSQILSGFEISSLHDTFTRVLRTESSSFTLAQTNNSAFVSRQNNRSGNRGGGTGNRNRDVDSRNQESGGIVCYYCHESGHTKRFCRKLHNKSQRGQSANVAASNTSSSDKTILVSTDEFAQFSQYQESLKSTTSPITAIAESSNSTTCLISSSSKWIIDFGALDHMTDPVSSDHDPSLLLPIALRKEEMVALDSNGTWDLVDLLVGKKAIGCKWVFAVKVKPDGSVARLKARLVAKRYAQTYGVDYFDTFSLVAKLTSVRLFMSMAATYDWPLHQLDIKNAFLHGDLQEEVYMEQPPEFVTQGEYGKVYHLRKSLYGLKQSLRAWFDKFSEPVQELGMKKSKCDHSVFYRQSEVGIILLLVYVDDIVITGSDTASIQSLKSFLHMQFQIKDLGLLKYFLGVEVTRSKKGIFLSQRKYVLDLLTKTGKLGAKPCNAPMTPNLQLTKEDGELFEDPEKHKRLVGKLNYLTVTHLDIAYSVNVVSQFMSAPTINHWAALEQIKCYSKGTPRCGLFYGNHGHANIECFLDANWTGSKSDRRSTTGYCVFIGGNLVSWKSKKHNVISRSSAELEYRAMAQTVCEVVWMYQLLSDVGLKSSLPTKLWCNNQATLHIASNPVFHEQTKHIEIDCHFVREKIQQKFISTGYVKIEDQLGDIFTKALNGPQVDYICSKLGMINIYAPA